MIGPAAGALLAETRRRPGRLVLTGLAILVATVFAAGTLLLSETLRGYVASRAQETPSAAAVVVRGQSVPIAAVAAVDGVAEVVEYRDTTRPVDGGTLWEITSDPMSGPLTRLAAPVAGRLPTAPGEVVLGEGTARRTGLAPGATLTITAPDGSPRAVVVTGVVPVTQDGVNTLLGLPDDVAALGAPLDQVDVAATPGTDPAALAARVAAAVGDPSAVRTGAEQRLDEAESASESVTAVLIGVGVFAGLALVAAAVVVASTFRIVLTQRRTQLALLRCVGARRGQVVGAVLVEAAVTGVVAGVLGVGIAVLAGYGLVGALGLAGIADAPILVVPWPALAGCLLVALLATVLAAVAPALAAARIPPVAALGVAGAGEAGAPRTGRRLVLAALLALVAGGSAALSTDGEAGLVVLAASGMVAFAAIVAAGPVLVRVLAGTVGRLVAAVGGGPGRLATANAAQVPRRTAATISVLALGVGLTSALLVGLAAAEAESQTSITELFPADIAIAAPDVPALAARLGADPALAVVTSDPSSVYVDPAPGVSAEAARAAVEAAVAGTSGVTVQYASDVRAELETVLLTLRLIGLALVGMTLLVAVVGVAVTLMLSVAERTRETGLLRAVGLSRGGVRAMVAWEAASSGSGAALLGAVVGAGYGVLGVRVLGIGSPADGFPLAALPSLGALVVAVVVLAVLASVTPAVRAGRVPPIRALQDA